MKELIKQLISFILPVTVLIVVPLWIEKNIIVHFGLPLLIGALFIIVGLIIITLNISAFIKIGKGTLAPWSPTRKLVTGGMYGHMRNPMISGVFIVLIGEFIAIYSWNIFLWAIIFFLINTVYFIVYEEPNLEKRFGNEYREYKSNVPRWIPRLKPFKSDSEIKMED